MVASQTTRVVFTIALLLIGVGVAAFVYVLGAVPATDPPRLGTRGLRRQQSMRENPLFHAIEPLLRHFAGISSHLPIPNQRRKVESLLVQAGDWLGITADEFMALTLFSSVAATAVGIGASYVTNLPGVFLFFFAGAGALVPYLRATSERDTRFIIANRSLPTAIDLAAMCMSAGLDFPGAMRQIVEKAGLPGDSLFEELQRILQELEIGRTRKEALESLAERVPTDSVREFVSAVVQAEEKGTPIAEVLHVQARMLRMRRSVMAEERAAKAALGLMLPLLLIFCTIILLLLGPFILQLGKTGLM